MIRTKLSHCPGAVLLQIAKASQAETPRHGPCPAVPPVSLGRTCGAQAVQYARITRSV